VQTADGGKGGIAEFFGGGDGQDDVVRRKLLGDVDEVDTNAGCRELVVRVMQLRLPRTLQQSRCPLGHIFDQDLTPPVQQEAIERRLVLVLGDGSARLARTASAPGKHFDGIP
jgi:hypothetical protein